MKTTRIAPGLYDVRVSDRLFEIEQVPDGHWQLVEIVGSCRHYWNHFVTKRSAIAAITADLAYTPSRGA